MAQSKNKSRSDSRVRVDRPTSSSNSSGLNFDFQDNRSIINLVLGAAVLVVLGVVLFNFLSNQKQNNQADLGPSGQTENIQPTGDVAKDGLPGKYTVKEGDTLFTIAQNYYEDGFKYSEIVTANKLPNENSIQAGQVLDIPKLDQTEIAQASAEASITPATSTAPVAIASTAPAATPQDMQGMDMSQDNQNLGTGGDPNQTVWGPKVSTDTYTVQAGDWLSKVAGRAYGDVMSYQKIAQANNIQNPDLIEPGTVLKIPR